MAYEVQEPFWQFVDHWQTLATGLLALAAGVGTVLATILSANREIDAAQQQTQTAQEQIATTLRIEHRRHVREEWAFYVTLEAAMGIVLEDVEATRQMLPVHTTIAGPVSMDAYLARQRIRKSSFAELRAASLRLGGDLTKPFLLLENEIDVFAAQWRPSMAAASGLTYNAGYHSGFHESLERIAAQASALQEGAGDARQKCLAELEASQLAQRPPPFSDPLSV